MGALADGGLVVGADGLARCGWSGSDPDYIRYHDNEWGVPVTDERALFQWLVLEGFQAGLSWISILKRRENFRAVFCDWEVEKVARLSDVACEKILTNPGIIRNRLKVFGAVRNARAFLRVQDECGGFLAYLHGICGKKVIRPDRPYASLREMPAQTPLAVALSRDMKKRDFTFCGPTIMYAFMQATGIVNDHMAGCHSLKRGRGGRG